MSSLETLGTMQEGFLDVLRGDMPSIGLGPSLVHADKTWAIYRRNHRDNHVTALADTYSTVVKLVGKDYFRQLAQSYVGRGESRSGDLNDYGEDFADFLAFLLPRRTEAMALSYLPDIARFDWVWFARLRAPEQGSPWLAKLAALSEARQLGVRGVPAATLLRSRHPVHSIWRLAEGDDIDVALDGGGESVLLTRVRQVEALRLDPAAATFVERWFNGDTLETALTAALTVGDPDLPALFNLLERQCAVKGILCDS